MSPSGSVVFACTIPPIRALSLSEFRLGLTELTHPCVFVRLHRTDMGIPSILFFGLLSSKKERNGDYDSKMSG